MPDGLQLSERDQDNDIVGDEFGPSLNTESFIIFV